MPDRKSATIPGEIRHRRRPAPQAGHPGETKKPLARGQRSWGRRLQTSHSRLPTGGRWPVLGPLAPGPATLTVPIRSSRRSRDRRRRPCGGGHDRCRSLPGCRRRRACGAPASRHASPPGSRPCTCSERGGAASGRRAADDAADRCNRRSCTSRSGRGSAGSRRGTASCPGRAGHDFVIARLVEGLARATGLKRPEDRRPLVAFVVPILVLFVLLDPDRHGDREGKGAEIGALLGEPEATALGDGARGNQQGEQGWRGETIMKDSSNCLERRSSGEGPAGCIDHAGAGLADFSDRGKKTGRAGQGGGEEREATAGPPGSASDAHQKPRPTPAVRGWVVRRNLVARGLSFSLA